MNSRKISLYLPLGILFIVVLAALFATQLTLQDPLQVNLAQRLQPMSASYPLGTDQLGRCLYARILHGAKPTLGAALLVLVASTGIGTALGLLAGFNGGYFDQILRKFIEGIMAFPSIILALVLTGILGPGLGNIVIAISVVHWVVYARLVRNMTASLRERTFVKAALVSGASQLSILYRHILPQLLAQLICFATLDYGRIILMIAGLSFLGLGVQPPTPEWGSMLLDGKAYMQLAPQMIVWPGLAIVLVVASLNTLSNALLKIWKEN